MPRLFPGPPRAPDLAGPGRPPSITPDAAIDVALPAAVTARGQRRSTHRLSFRRLLFDVKTIHGGTDHYYSAHARSEQSGAVRHREHSVWPEYQSAARALDEEHSAPGTTPILDRLRMFTRTRGLVFGAYGEASADVHDLIKIGARAQATRLWRLFGARSESEMYSYLVSRARRRIGMAAVHAMARHRIARIPYIGVPRRVVEGRRRRSAAAARARDWAPAVEHYDFFAFQAQRVEVDA